MQARTATRVLIFVIAVFTLGLLASCSHLEKAPNREGYAMYHKPLPEADRAVAKARMAGKDKECPAEFNAASAQVDKAFEIYMACRTKEAMDMAQDAINKINALCPPKPVVEVKPEPKPVPPPPPPPPAPLKIVLEDIHFDFDKATLTDEAKGILDRNIRTLKQNPGIKVQIEGHTCAHGAEDYNMALGERRANAVKEYLANQGIDSGRMSSMTYGETRLAKPEVPTPKNKNSEEAKENRRVHFEVIVK